jgi:hypothetical protein
MSSHLIRDPDQDVRQLIKAIENSIKNGVRHFRESDGKFLPTVESVLIALRKGGGVLKKYPERKTKGGIILP